jgi:hypothetical protein
MYRSRSRTARGRQLRSIITIDSDGTPATICSTVMANGSSTSARPPVNKTAGVWASGVVVVAEVNAGADVPST